MSDSKHTPTVKLYDEQGKYVCELNDNTKFAIARCVNSHAALLAACRAAVEALYYATRCGAQSRDEQEAVNSCRVQLEAAIREAT